MQTFEEWLEFYSPGAKTVFSEGEIAPLRAAWFAAAAAYNRPEVDARDFQRGLHEAKIACLGVLLGTNPRDHATDRAYDKGVNECISAIARLSQPQPQGER